VNLGSGKGQYTGVLHTEPLSVIVRNPDICRSDEAIRSGLFGTFRNRKVPKGFGAAELPPPLRFGGQALLALKFIRHSRRRRRTCSPPQTPYLLCRSACLFVPNEPNKMVVYTCCFYNCIHYCILLRRNGCILVVLRVMLSASCVMRCLAFRVEHNTRHITQIT